MNEERTRNPGADRQLWNEPRRLRGRKVVWLIGMPLVIGMIGVTGVAASDRHVQFNLPFGLNAPVVSTAPPKAPAIDYVVTPKPANPDPQPNPAKGSKANRSR